jgi:hypothetical protein
MIYVHVCAFQYWFVDCGMCLTPAHSCKHQVAQENPIFEFIFCFSKLGRVVIEVVLVNDALHMYIVQLV